MGDFLCSLLCLMKPHCGVLRTAAHWGDKAFLPLLLTAYPAYWRKVKSHFPDKKWSFTVSNTDVFCGEGWFPSELSGQINECCLFPYEASCKQAWLSSISNFVRVKKQIQLNLFYNFYSPCEHILFWKKSI